MAITTLFTFSVCIPHASSVQIVGSWDNFRTLYALDKDRQRGNGHWVGCHVFKDILCDGDPSHAFKRRSGNLKQGGIYWYHYLLDGHVEHIDPSRPATSKCPLLPGQILNVLEVPVELPTCLEMNPVPSAQTAFTLDPRDRFKKLRNLPHSRSAVPQGMAHAKNASPVLSSGMKRSRVSDDRTRDNSYDTLQRSKDLSNNLSAWSAPIHSVPNLDRNMPLPMLQRSIQALRGRSSDLRPPTRDGITPAADDSAGWYNNTRDQTAESFGLSPPGASMQNFDRGTPVGNSMAIQETSSHGAVEQNLGQSPLSDTSQEHSYDYEAPRYQRLPVWDAPLAVRIPSYRQTDLRQSKSLFTIPFAPNKAVPVQSLSRPAEDFAAQKSTSMTSIWNNKSDNNLAHFETPPQLCEDLSTDISPLSVNTPTPPRLRREIRRLPSMNNDILPFSHCWQTQEAKVIPAHQASSTAGNPNVYGPHVQHDTSDKSRQRVTASENNPYPVTELPHFKGFDVAPKNHLSHHHRWAGESMDPQPWNFELGLGITGLQGGPRDAMFQDLGYLSEYIA